MIEFDENSPFGMERIGSIELGFLNDDKTTSYEIPIFRDDEFGLLVVFLKHESTGAVLCAHGRNLNQLEADLKEKFDSFKSTGKCSFYAKPSHGLF